MRVLNARVLTAVTVSALALWAMAAGAGVIRADLARPAAGGSDLRLRHDALTRTLAARPLAAQGWVSLAALRSALAMPQASVDAAFMMSGVTGPAEGDVMAQRAMLGLLLWETGGTEMTNRIAGDLCGLMITDSSRIRLVLSTKSGDVRAAIRNALADHGCTPRVIASIGL